MNQLPAIVPASGAPGSKLPLRPGATALVPLEAARDPALRQDPLPQGPLAERFEVRRSGAEARRGFGGDGGPLLEKRRAETGFVLAPRDAFAQGGPVQRSNSRLAAQLYAQDGAEVRPEAQTRALAQGSEAYRKAGAEPSLRPEAAQLFNLSV